jgi:ubiquinone/menaquinone biosynthesis C-methylase UbiE
MEYSRDEVLEANVKLHTQLSEVYRETEPHYRKENVERVENIIKNIKDEVKGQRLLDIGCGMGFIIDIAKNFFDQIDGIDITPAMLERVNTESTKCKICLHAAEAEKMPFEAESFDVCTAYAVLHHLYNLNDVFREIYRVLKKGGVFYSDLDPNFYFWHEFQKLDPNAEYSDIVKREVLAVNKKDEELEEKFNVDKKVLAAAEALKHVEGGFKEEELTCILRDVGFSDIKIIHEWFVGEGKYIHDAQKKQYVDEIKEYLRLAFPVTRHLFKYIRIIAKK